MTIQPESVMAQRIALALRLARARARLSQAEAAAAIGVAPNTICGWEAGERMPLAPKLAALCDLYGCSADFLLGRSEHPTGLPPGALLVDYEKANRVRRATSVDDLEALVDWQPQLFSFWSVVNAHTTIAWHSAVTALTIELTNHVRDVAPELWGHYVDAQAELKRRKNKWDRRRGQPPARGAL